KSRANCEFFDADKIGSSLILRHWRPGDRFQPIGMGFSVKLQDLFMNQKILRSQRHRLIVGATSKGEVYWVEGLRLAERFKLDKKTIRVLKWCWDRV
ncbi:MAG TPA: tRNA lysidine(34) synthetase TilS, partial [Verrucomicrobiae bacterium]|nr:tRNA lysidine(34) synthetase TilS [Verrucomicrobiae bacterium]